jgi:methyl-accepting chemotaxis protein
VTPLGLKERVFPELEAAVFEHRLSLFRAAALAASIGMPVFAVLAVLDAAETFAMGLMISVPTMLAVVATAAGYRISSRGRYHAGVLLALAAQVGIISLMIAVFGTRDFTVAIGICPILLSAILLERALVFVSAGLMSTIYAALTSCELTRWLSIPLRATTTVYPTEWHGSVDSAIVAQVAVDSSIVVVFFFVAAVLSLLAPRSLTEVIARLSGSVESLGRLRDEQTATARRLDDEVEQITLSARGQQRGSAVQSSAASDVAAVLRELLAASQRIAELSVFVAEQSEETARSQRVIASRIEPLSTIIESIGELLEGMQEVADRADLLAMNAALEGSQAGQRRLGFGLIASKMRELATSVVTEVEDMRAQMEGIHDALGRAMTVAGLSEKVSGQIDGLAAEIRDLAERQRRWTEDTSRVMDDLARAAEQAAEGTALVTEAILKLTRLSDDLRALRDETECEGDGVEVRREERSLFPALATLERQRRLSLFRTLLPYMIGGTLLFTVVALLETHGSVAAVLGVVLPSLALCVVARLGLRWAEEGHLHRGATVSLVATIAILGYFSALYGARGAVVFIASLALIIGAILLEREVVLLLTALAGAVLLALSAAELYQLLPLPVTPPHSTYPLGWQGSSDPEVSSRVFLDAVTLILVYLLSAVLTMLPVKRLKQMVSRLDGTIGALYRLIESQSSGAEEILGQAQSISAATEQQRESAEAQSAAMERVGLELGELLEASRQITGKSSQALDESQRLSRGHLAIADTIQALRARTRLVAQLLDELEVGAEKTEILALLAGLEGVTEVEGGALFSAMASQMQSFADDVSTKVRAARRLTRDFDVAADAVDEATQRGQQLSGRMAELASAIKGSAQHQAEGTERVAEAVTKISAVLRRTTEGARVVAEAACNLTELSETMHEASRSR